MASINMIIFVLGLVSLSVACGYMARRHAIQKGYKNPERWFWYGVLANVLIIGVVAAANKKKAGSVFEVKL